MRVYKRIMSYALVLVAILSFVAVPVKASETITLPPGWGRSTFWDHGKGGGFGERFSTEQDYSDYVEELPATGIDSEGGIIWYPTFGDFISLPRVRVFGNYFDLDSLSEVSGNYHVVWSYDLSQSFITFRLWSASSSSSFDSSRARIEFASSDLNVPISGFYSRLSTTKVVGSYRNDDGTFNFDNDFFFMYSSSDSSFYDTTISVDLYPFVHSSAPFYDANFIFYLPVYRIVPTSGLINTQSDTIYNINTRAGSITGDYGVLGDNNTITKSDTTYIVSEDDNSVYNPVTNTTTTYDNWTYDYSDRSYTLTKVDGDTTTTTTVTYGDENVTIKEGDTSYTVYYLYQTGSGEDTGSGDDTGSGGGSGSGSNSGIFGKLGDLIGTVLGGILSMLEAIVGKLLDALTSLAEMISDKLAKIVEMVLGWFDEIPKMFSGFLDLLAAIFPFIPPELMMLLSFGLAAVLFIGIVKAIRR